MKPLWLRNIIRLTLFGGMTMLPNIESMLKYATYELL